MYIRKYVYVYIYVCVYMYTHTHTLAPNLATEVHPLSVSVHRTKPLSAPN